MSLCPSDVARRHKHSLTPIRFHRPGHVLFFNLKLDHQLMPRNLWWVWIRCCSQHVFLQRMSFVSSLCLQPKSKLYRAKSAETNHQVSTTESLHVRDVRWVNALFHQIIIFFWGGGLRYLLTHERSVFYGHESVLMLIVYMCLGFLQTESAEQCSLLLPPPEELPHRQNKPQPLPTLPPAEMSRPRNVQRWWGLMCQHLYL